MLFKKILIIILCISNVFIAEKTIFDEKENRFFNNVTQLNEIEKKQSIVDYNYAVRLSTSLYGIETNYNNENILKDMRLSVNYVILDNRYFVNNFSVNYVAYGISPNTIENINSNVAPETNNFSISLNDASLYKKALTKKWSAFYVVAKMSVCNFNNNECEELRIYNSWEMYWRQ